MGIFVHVVPVGHLVKTHDPSTHWANWSLRQFNSPELHVPLVVLAVAARVSNAEGCTAVLEINNVYEVTRDLSFTTCTPTDVAIISVV
jgi:hypothetical protein